MRAGPVQASRSEPQGQPGRVAALPHVKVGGNGRRQNFELAFSSFLLLSRSRLLAPCRPASIRTLMKRFRSGACWGPRCSGCCHLRIDLRNVLLPATPRSAATTQSPKLGAFGPRPLADILSLSCFMPPGLAVPPAGRCREARTLRRAPTNGASARPVCAPPPPAPASSSCCFSSLA